MQNKKWILFPQDVEKSKEISEKLNISPITAQVLINRGIKNSYQAKEFLSADFSHLTPPLNIPNVQKAVNLIRGKIERGEKILIYGDFDVDGISGTALLLLALSKIGANVNYYVPKRIKGHGLDKNSILQAKKQGFSLIITVDCGSSDNEEIEYAKELGIELIITDHHLPEEKITQDVIVINPKFGNEPTPYYELSGCGVSYILTRALLDEEEAKEYLDIVTLGTVGDIVPLLGENRILVKEGLKFLKNTKRTGIKTLLEITGLLDKDINADYHIPYILVPRLNSAGRLWEPYFAVDLLLTENKEKAEKIVRILDDKNRERQALQEKIFKEALKIIEELNLASNKIIIVKGELWHSGVIGIVSSKIVENFYRPSIMITEEDTKYAKGSCRSIEGFHIFEALKEQENLLLKYGGHKLAAGFVIEKEKIKEFTENLKKLAEEKLKEEDITPKIFTDKEINFNQINQDLVKELNLLSPFGCGNPQPLFLTKKVQVLEINTVGRQKHLKLKLKQDRQILEGIWFKEGEKIKEIAQYPYIDIVFIPEINSFREEEKVQLNIKDIRKSN